MSTQTVDYNRLGRKGGDGEKSTSGNNEYQMQSMKSSSLKVRVQEEIRNYIKEKGLETGDSLPTEKELSEQLGTSRTVIREALNGLELIGLVETRHGVGRFIGKPNVNSIVKNLVYTIHPDTESFRDLIEIRITLETSFILRDLSLFADQDIRDFRENLEMQKKMIESACEEEKLIRAHAEFHSMLMRNSDNKLLINLINMFSQIQTSLYWQQRYMTNDRIEYYEIHQRLVDAIETKDSEIVQKCLRDHYLEPVEWVRNSNVRISIPWQKSLQCSEDSKGGKNE